MCEEGGFLGVWYRLAFERVRWVLYVVGVCGLCEEDGEYEEEADEVAYDLALKASINYPN